jgi:hypothetical protein
LDRSRLVVAIRVARWDTAAKKDTRKWLECRRITDRSGNVAKSLLQRVKVNRRQLIRDDRHINRVWPVAGKASVNSKDFARLAARPNLNRWHREGAVAVGRDGGQAPHRH